MSGVGQRREVVRRGLHREEAGMIALAALIATLAVTGLAGQITSQLSGAGWPAWNDGPRRVNLLGPILGAYIHAGDPMRGWPGVPAGQTPAAWLFWLVFALLLAVAAAVVILLVRQIRRRRPAPGFASSREVIKRLGARALLKQAPRLRPQLARTTARPRPEQLGTFLGRDVNTGIDCYSSVRQSRYVVGPSESGKTAAVVIPEALDHDGPLLAPSSRADVMAATWAARRERGPVWLFDPLRTAPALPLLQWDPVRDCEDPATAMRRAQALMSSVDMSGVSNGDAWKNRGRAVLRNLLHAAALSHGDVRTVLRWTYDQTSVEPAGILERSTATSGSWAEMQYSVINTPERQRAGYYMAVEGAMEAFQHPAVLEACTPKAGQHFDIAQYLDPRTGLGTVFLLADRTEAVAVSDVLAALMDEVLYQARLLGQRSENNRLDPALKFLVDEAPNTATLAQLPNLISDGGGRGIPTTMVVQDRAQAVGRWGREDAQSMWGAATVRQVLPGVAGLDEMREIAGYFDEYDEEIPSFGYQSGGHSTQYSLRARSAMSTAAVRSIPAFHSIVIAAGGLKPVLTELQPYFQRTDAAATADAEKRFFAALNEGRVLL